MVHVKAKPLAIIGASGHGKVVAEIAQVIGYDDIQFYDDRADKLVSSYPFPVKGTVAQLLEQKSWNGSVFLAIGNNNVRQQLHLQFTQLGFRLATLIHPAAIVSPSAILGEGSVAMAGAVVNAASVIGKGCILNTGCSVDHDCTLGDFVHVSPGTHLAGNVFVGNQSWLGIGSAVVQGLNICEQVQLGANTTVVADIKDAGLYVGSPAKRIK